MSHEPKKSIYELLGPGGLPWAELTLKQEGYLSGHDLALVLENNPAEMQTAWLREYLIRHLRGEVKRRPGPKNADDSVRHVRESLAFSTYERAHRIAKAYLRCRRKKAKSRGETLPRGETTAHELALRYLQERVGLYSDVSPERLRDIISSRRSRLKPHE